MAWHFRRATGIAARAAALRAGLAAAAARAGRDPTRLRIVAVTKTWPAAVCRSAVEAGLTALGENRVQEALPKVAALPDAEWHLVGHLQSNKARAAVGAFGWIHSVDSAALLSVGSRPLPTTSAAPRSSFCRST